MRNLAGRSRIGVFAEAVAGLVVTEILGLSGERAYYRYVDGRHGRWFPEGSIMTRREYERWRTETQQQDPEIRC
jgi:hypothetical protein